LSQEAVGRLLQYHWPGNVRELQNIIERAVILSEGPDIAADAVGIHPTAARGAPSHRKLLEGSQSPLEPGPISLSEAERRAIVRACVVTGWRISGSRGAAKLLGLKPTTLHAKMKRLGIRRPSTAPNEDESARIERDAAPLGMGR
jgi:transcriptional regulator of acetoin/glycerol metabolism